MGLLSLEHGRFAYRADFVLYGLVIAALAVDQVVQTPASLALERIGWVLGGGLAWTLVEYLVHRFVLHGLPPFQGWHAAHHRRPSALIGLPTVLSAALFAALVFAPAWWLLGGGRARAFMLGVLAGYLIYAVVHHLVHHAARQTVRVALPGGGGRGAKVVDLAQVRGAKHGGPMRGTRPARWLRQRRIDHAQHHGSSQGQAGFGVTNAVWDRVFGTNATSEAAIGALTSPASFDEETRHGRR